MLRSLAIPLLAATALVSAALAHARASDLPGPTVPEGFGVNIHFTDPAPGEMERFAEAGFKWVRMDFFWEGIEREPGKYDFSAYDRLLGHLDKVGARAYFILDYGHRNYDDGLSPRTPAGRAAFAKFAGAAAAHFKRRGVVWEIWNEPNISFWKPEPNADDYAKLAVQTAKAIREADREALILAPGSSGFPWEFFETAFDAGLLDLIDGVSVHPYRESYPETAAEDYGRLRALMARYASKNPRHLKIVSGEWGYSTAEKRFSEADQARYIVREYLSNLANGVDLSIFYDWKDDGPDPKENEHRFGTVRQDLTPKPSFLAARDLIRSLRGYGFRHRLRGATAAEWKLLFQKGQDAEEPLAVVSWTTDADAPEAARTPSIRYVRETDPDVSGLRALASLRIIAGPLVETGGSSPSLAMGVPNRIKAEDVEIRVAGSADKLPRNDMVSMVGMLRHDLIVRLPADPFRSPRREVQLEILHKGEPLPAIAPIQVWRVDPLTLAIAPRGNELKATIENPSKLPFNGRLVARKADGSEAASAVVTIPKGRGEASASLPANSGGVELALVDAQDAAVLPPVAGRFEAIRDAGGKDLFDGLDAVLHVDNKPTPAKPLKAEMVDSEGKKERTLRVPFAFDAGWRYLMVQPRKGAPIPEKAREAYLWIKGDRSNAFVRCRFHDSTGQTFQPDLGRLDFDGWKLVRIPLDGSAPGGRWGGAGDGVPHGPLAWEAVLLLDSPDQGKGGSGSVVLASPSYRLAP